MENNAEHKKWVAEHNASVLAFQDDLIKERQGVVDALTYDGEDIGLIDELLLDSACVIVDAFYFMDFIEHYDDDRPAYAWQRGHWFKYGKPALTEEHRGDCTKEPWPCSRCHSEEVVKMAKGFLGLA